VSILFRPSSPAVERRDWGHVDVFGRGKDLDSKSSTAFYSANLAMSLSAVAACVELRANYISQLPFDSYRDGPNGSSLKVSPQPGVVARPSAKGVPRSSWMKQAQYARLLWGNATLLVGSRDAAGYPKSLDVLPPWDVTFTNTGITERLQVFVGGVRVATDDVIVVPGQVVPGRTVGVAPLAACGLVDLGIKAQDFGRNWFANGAVPSSIIYSESDLDGPQSDAIVNTIMSKWRRRKPAVLGAGLKYEKISVPANESQFIETIRQNQAEIAIVLGLSPEAIGVSVSGSSVTYANREQNQQQTMVNTVNSDILLWQEVLYDVVPPAEFIRFSSGALLRTDLKARYEAYALGVAGGWLTVDEPRSLEDLPPMPDGVGGATDERSLSIAEQLQKIYLAVNTVITADEARGIVGIPGPFVPTTTEVPNA